MKKLIYAALAACLMLGACSDDTPERQVYHKPADKTDTDKNTDPENPVNRPHKQISGQIHAEGRWLVDENGNHVNLHGFWQTHSPYFNQGKWGWDHNTAACLSYNTQQIDDILMRGWSVDFMRLHMDPHWMTSHNRPQGSWEIDYFSEVEFQKALTELYVPLVKHCISKGLYVLIHPGIVGPGPDDPRNPNKALKYDDKYHKVMKTVWNMISSEPELANNPNVWFELLNEPVNIMDESGATGSAGDSFEKALTKYMQSFVDIIRGNGADNLLWVPGTSYQQHYTGYLKYPIDDYNYGYAIHCYPGWYGSDCQEATAEYGQGGHGLGLDSFQKGWEAEIGAIAQTAPVMITEMDWAPASYKKSWGKAVTGEAGGEGFGANFKYLADKTGNVSYIFFTAPEHLAIYDWREACNLINPMGPDIADTIHNFLYDPMSCNNHIYAWYQAYAQDRLEPLPEELTEIKIGGTSGNSFVLNSKMTAVVNAITNKQVVFPLQSGADIKSDNASVVRVSNGNVLLPVSNGTAKVTISALGRTRDYTVTVKPYELDWKSFNPNIHEKGSWDAATGTLVTGQYGFGGFNFTKALDLSAASKIVCVLGAGTDLSSGASFRLFDRGYWDGAVESPGVSATDKNAAGDYELVIDLTKTYTIKDRKFDPSSIMIMGIWTYGDKKVIVKDIYWE